MEKGQITVGGVTRTFHVYVPPSGTQKGPGPLVIALHGAGTNGVVMAGFSGLNEKAQEAGFLVAYPDGSGRQSGALTWNAGDCCGYARRQGVDDVGFLARLIDHLLGRYSVDPGRVYVTGISNGAMMAYRLAAELPERIAAVAAVAGTLAVDPKTIRQGVAVIHFHGTDDKYVPYGGGRGQRSAPTSAHRSVDETIQAWVRANGAGAKATVTSMPDLAQDGTTVTRFVFSSPADPQAVVLYKVTGGGHTWPGRPRLERLLGVTTVDISANDLMWEFFLAHRRGPPRAVRE